LDVERGDIVVCQPGFTNDRDDRNYGGAGYVEGMIRCIGNRHDHKDDARGWIYFGFYHDNGVYEQALRLATAEEIEFFRNGHDNINGMMKLFKVKYINKDDEEINTDVKARSTDEVRSTLTDLKSLIYMMG
jgi:hypothetical protein